MSANACTIYLKEKDEVIASVETAPGGDEIWIGRSHECALRCRPDDLTVSGHHARLFWDGDGLWIEDAGSRNGLLHNGVKLELAHKLLAGELIALGIGDVEEITTRLSISTLIGLDEAERNYSSGGRVTVSGDGIRLS